MLRWESRSPFRRNQRRARIRSTGCGYRMDIPAGIHVCFELARLARGGFFNPLLVLPASGFEQGRLWDYERAGRGGPKTLNR